MAKDFEAWNFKKKQLDSNTKKVLFQERDVWWFSVGLNVGVEQDGKGHNFTRPVLVLRKFSQNQFLGIPSTRSKKTSKYYFQIVTEKQSFNFILSQARVFDAQRLSHRLLTLSDLNMDMEAVKKVFKKLYGL